MSSRRGNVHGSLRRGVADVEVVNEGWITPRSRPATLMALSLILRAALTAVNGPAMRRALIGFPEAVAPSLVLAPCTRCYVDATARPNGSRRYAAAILRWRCVVMYQAAISLNRSTTAVSDMVSLAKRSYGVDRHERLGQAEDLGRSGDL